MPDDGTTSLSAPDDALEVLARFEAMRAAIGLAKPAYLRLNALTQAHPDHRDPDDFARALLAELFQGREAWPASRVAAFFAWAEARSPSCALLLVLGAIAALDDGRAAEAERLARRALALAQNNLHMQSLLAEASGHAAPETAGRFCRSPFENIETSVNGDVHFCCPAWLPVPIGNLMDDNADAVWNSPAAREVRRSIHDGDFKYCSRTHCPHLSSDGLPAADTVENRDLRPLIEARETNMARRPRKIVLAHDRSCNLSCPSCRTSVILARKDEQKRLNAMADAVILPLARDADRLHVTASGDPFASAHFRYVLKKITRDVFPSLRLDIQTNGLLFDEQAWTDLDLSGKIDKVSVSIDAATEKTYEIVRRGGDFGRLLRNLDFLARMRREGEFKIFRLDFVVQAVNFREMPVLVELARGYGFDSVKFQMIRNWNTFTPEEFAVNDIGSPEHPDHEEFLAVLRLPSLRRKDVAFWGMANALRQRLLMEQPHPPESTPEEHSNRGDLSGRTV